MLDAMNLLAKPLADSTVVAAETEAIELLLPSKRKKMSPSSSSSSASSNNQSSAGESNSQSNSRARQKQSSMERFDFLTTGKLAPIQKRRLGKVKTGKTGQKLPEEFRYGLDRFFERLEFDD